MTSWRTDGAGFKGWPDGLSRVRPSLRTGLWMLDAAMASNRAMVLMMWFGPKPSADARVNRSMTRPGAYSAFPLSPNTRQLMPIAGPLTSSRKAPMLSWIFGFTNSSQSSHMTHSAASACSAKKCT